uniref:ORF33 n=1 Tax=Nitrosopumilaceae spindle-shaped virus TaxID=3065433 RepID=A0AAT9J945_9VIRU
MIEVIFLMMLGNADALTDLQIDIDEQTEKVAELEAEFEELKTEKRDKEVKMNVLFVEYKSWDNKYENEETQAMKSYYYSKYLESKNLWRDEFQDLKKIETKYDSMEHDLETAKVLLEKMEGDFEKIQKANSNPDRYTNVSISLSKNCQTMIEHGLYTNCPTYRELVELFDTTNPTASGHFVDMGYDVKRVGIMDRHWKFYETEDNYDLVMVDPDAPFQSKSIAIEIQASKFTTLSVIGSDNSRSFNQSSYTTWENFKQTPNCKKIIVAPDIELIKQAVKYAVNDCNGEIDVLENTVVHQEPTPHNDRNWRDSPALVYQNWLREAIENNKGLMLGLG